MGGDTTQSLGGSPGWGMALLHKVWEVDVTREAIAVSVARSLLLFSRLRGTAYRGHEKRGEREQTEE